MREHMESENHHDFDTTMGTFHHPATRSSPRATSTTGREGVGLLPGDAEAFPDQRNELIELRHSDDAVVVEFDLKGTHRARSAGCRPRAGSSPAGCPFFLFDEDRLVGERVYFDSATIQRQLGIAHDPLTLRAASRRS